MILTHDTILEEIRGGNIKIEPFCEDCAGPGSVDLHLGNAFRVFKNRRKVFPVTEEAGFEEITVVKEIKNGKSIVLKSGETILGITQERITLAPNIAGWLEGRSRFARLGLAIHITSGFIQPGTDNKQVLEISNLGRAPLAIKPGTNICQIIFNRCEGEARYLGRFSKQISP